MLDHVVWINYERGAESSTRTLEEDAKLLREACLLYTSDAADE